MMPVCLLFVYSRSGIIFILSTSVITDYSQSAKGIDPYFKSLICGGPSATEGYTHFTEWAE